MHWLSWVLLRTLTELHTYSKLFFLLPLRLNWAYGYIWQHIKKLLTLQITILYICTTGGHRHRSQCRRYPTSDIRHRHLFFRYRRQICRTEKRLSDIGSVPISPSELIPISNMEEIFFLVDSISTSLGTVSERYNTKLLCLSIHIEMSDIGYRIKVFSDIRYNVGLRSLSPISWR